MASFVSGHATHPDWRMALAIAAAQVDAARAARDAQEPGDVGPLTLGFIYFTGRLRSAGDAAAGGAEGTLAGCRVGRQRRCRRRRLRVEYIDEPALVLMLAACRWTASRSSRARGRYRVSTPSALSCTPTLRRLTCPKLIAEMSERVASGYLFGGLAASRGGTVHLADGVWQGGLSGVASAPVWRWSRASRRAASRWARCARSPRPNATS